jgi:hypothetical protein
MIRQSLAFMIILTGVFLAACATGASIESISQAARTSEETLLSTQSFAAGATIIEPTLLETSEAALSAADDARIESYGLNWKLLPVSNSPETFRIIEVRGTSFKDHADPTKALDLLIMNSPDYKAPGDFYSDVQPMMYEVFGIRNVLDFDPAARFPFNYYVTSFQYSALTPVKQNSLCLPRKPVPQSNTLVPSVNMPTWNCNIALSTIGTNGVSLDLGLIIHRGDIGDSSQFNLFSSEHNSYATILHELSHAAFAMSDEYKGPHGKFHPLDSPNVYRTKTRCDEACPNICVPIEDTDLYRCKPADDTTNLMYFFPQPDPGINEGWRKYQYYFPSNGRLKYIYGECAKGEC